MKQPLTERWSWALYLALAFGYYFSGQLLSAISNQTQVVAIWAPAGIALVGCYLWWWRFFPAVFLASVAFNFSTQQDTQFSDLLSPLGLEVSLIAFGATLQAAVGSALLRYWLGEPLGFQSDRQTISFIFIVGIAVNLISPNIGVYALSYFSDNYSPDNHWSNVLYWWLGDSLGVLLVTPVLLSLLLPQTQTKQTSKTRLMILSASGLLFASVTLTTLFFSQNSYTNAATLVKREVNVVESRLHYQINLSLLHIQTLANFVQNHPQLGLEEFDTYVSQLSQNQPTIKAMSWNPIIKSQHGTEFEQQLSELYNKPMFIKGIPLEEKDPLVVVKFISPQVGNAAAIGFNVYSNQKRKSVLSDPRLLNQPMATPIIQLVQSEKAEPGYLLFAPVYGYVR
ncbi:MAG: integral membrane sensor domain MASE1, partial [Phenylobacterium sp.]